MIGARERVIAAGCAFLGFGLCAAARAGQLEGTWHPVGSSINGTPVGLPSGLAGRVSAVLSLPGSPPTEIVGTLGGIWEQTGNRPWRDVTSATWPSTAVNSLASDPKHPAVIYAGTGYDD